MGEAKIVASVNVTGSGGPDEAGPVVEDQRGSARCPFCGSACSEDEAMFYCGTRRSTVARPSEWCESIAAAGLAEAVEMLAVYLPPRCEAIIRDAYGSGDGQGAGGG